MVGVPVLYNRPRLKAQGPCHCGFLTPRSPVNREGARRLGIRLQTLQELDLDGFQALRALIEASAYRSLAQAVASLTVFSHPLTVDQTGAHAVFPIIRNLKRRGEVDYLNGRLIGFDDNTSPTEAFSWANGLLRRPRDLQFNHVYSRSTDPDCYTNLANVCISPSFLAKLTDTDTQIQALLRYRAYTLYGWYPADEHIPNEPGVYGDLIWADPIPATDDLRHVLCSHIQKRQNRTTRMIAQTGWLFG